jgi:hypothetical protein
MSRAFASLDASGQEKLRSELVRLWSAHNKATDNTTKVDAEYLEVIAIRDSNLPDAPKTSANRKIGGSLSRRAEALADRIEAGAAGLAAFVEGLSEAEWRTPVSRTTHYGTAGTIWRASARPWAGDLRNRAAINGVLPLK